MCNSLGITRSILAWAPAAFALLTACSDGGDDGNVENTPPSVDIVSPADGSSFVETDTITVTVQVTDPDESDLSVIDLAWAVDASSSAGPAQPDGSGAASYDLTLAQGSHQVVVTVTDPDGETGVNTINLTVGPDADGDGYGPPEDCDDANADIHPGAVELCNDIDDDCLNGPDDSVTFVDWYTDADGDGFGDPATGVNSCEDLSATLVDDGTDCDDDVATTFPGATEECNSVDDDCANGADDGLLFQEWYSDADLDGYGNPITEVSSCEDLSATHILDGTDCNDLDASLNGDDADGDGVDSCSDDCNDNDATIVPGAVEVCNDIDDNCTDGIDEGLVKTNWYIDADLDGYGDAATEFPSCFDQSLTHILDGTDCDDQDAAANHDDVDVDGTDSCTGDCNDLDPTVFPGATDICNDIDDNCAGGIDEGLVKTDWYVDADADGFGDPATLLSSCLDHSADHITDGTDCDDDNPDVNPKGVEVCNGLDDDCNRATLEIAQVDGVQFSTVSAAVAAAPDGGTVELCAGTFPVANVTINKVLTITGFGGDRNASTLDGTTANNTAMLLVNGGELHLQSLTVANAKKNGAINATTGKGGPVFVDDCLLRDNTTGGIGGAIVGTDITISNSTLLRNEAASGGAVHASAPGVLTVTDSVFESNTATVSGGGFFSRTTTTFTGVDLFANVALSNGGGGSIDAVGDTAVFTDTFFTSNTAINGGGLHAFQTSVVADGATTFDSNAAIGGFLSAYGGGAYVQANGQDVTWTGGLFVGNIADSDGFAAGGGINLDNGVVGGSIDASFITADRNSTFGPANAHTGGGIWTSGAPMTLSDILTMNNTSDYGGGTSLNSGGKSPITLERVEYHNNVGLNAGATDVYDATVTMTDCVFIGNAGDAAHAAVLVDVAGALGQAGHLEVITSDFSTGVDDNTPFDVMVNFGAAPPVYSYGDGVSFVCDQTLGTCI
jgi:hypothetical protein